jgi:hypothetical protein
LPGGLAATTAISLLTPSWAGRYILRDLNEAADAAADEQLGDS